MLDGCPGLVQGRVSDKYLRKLLILMRRRMSDLPVRSGAAGRLAWSETLGPVSVNGKRITKERAMAKEREIAEKFWKALRSDRTLMLGLAGVQEGHSQPMTAQLADDRDGGPIWFFTSSDTDLAKALGKPHRAVAHFAAKGHDLFASIHGELVMDNDRTMIDRLWNRFVAAWFEGGQEDPKLRLLRLDAERAQIWLNENNLAAGVRLLLGRDPKKEYKDKIAEVELPE
jgi:general stress protein 26